MTDPKVLHVSEADEWSGGAAQLLALAGGLRTKGWRCALACRPTSALAREAAREGLEAYPIALRQDYDLVSAARLSRLIAREGFTLVHAHHSRAHGVALLAKAMLPRAKAPLLVVSRRVSFSPGINPFSRWKYRSALIDSYAAVADAVKDVLVKAGVPAARVAVVRSGVDAARFSPRPPSSVIYLELDIPQGRHVIGKIANASEWKGQTTFLEAAALLVRQKRPVHFLLAGRDTDGAWIRGEVSRLGLQGHVSLAGFRADVPELLSVLKVSVNAATRGEGLSGALRESLCMGVAVVASDIAGNRELLGHMGEEFLFPPGDSRALAARLCWALDHPERVKDAVENWRLRRLPEFTAEATVSQTEALYRSLLARR